MNQQQQEDHFWSLFNETVKEAKRKEQLRPTRINWIYGAKSPLFPDMIKIGRAQDPEARMSSGNTFTAPSPFVIIAKTQTLDSIRDEKATHLHFKEFRAQGEFFKVSEEDLKSYFDNVLTPLFNEELKVDVARLAGAQAENEHSSTKEPNNNIMDENAREFVQTDEFQSNKKRKRELDDRDISETRMALEKGQFELEIKKIELERMRVELEERPERFRFELEREQLELEIKKMELAERPERFRLELEKGKLELEIKKIELERKKIELERMMIEHEVFKVKAPVDFIIQCMTTIQTMCGGLNDDEKLRYRNMLMMAADSQMKYIVAYASGTAVVYEEREEVPEIPFHNRPISIAEVAESMGITNLTDHDYKKIDKIAQKNKMVQALLVGV